MAFSGVIREADTEEAANTAEARGRRSVAAARAGLPPPMINPPRPSQPTGQQAAGQATGETTGQTDPFGALIGLLRDSLIVFGIPTRGMLANAKETRKRKQAVQDYNTVTTATLNMQDLFGGMNKGPVRTAAAEAHIAQLERSFPGLGEPVRAAWEAVENQGVDLPSAIEHQDKALAFCGTGLDAQTCINKLFSDEDLIQQWNDEADQDRLPDITDRFNLIADAVRQSGGDDVLKQLAEGGWDLAELRRLPKEFQFTDNQLRTINRNKEIQNSLISVGLNPASLDVKQREAEITEGTKAKFRQAPAGTGLVKLQAERAKAEAAGDTRLAEELNKKIIKEITITGRTPEDVRTGLTGATPKDLDKLRSGIRDLQGNLEELEKTRKAFEANPEAGGILGTLLETAGGLLGQLPFIGEDLADLLPGDQEKVKKARTQARFTVASMLTTITKEETGRFTDTERAIAQEAVAALDVTASARQIQAALGTAIDIMTDSQNRKVDELLSASGLNLPGDLDKFHKILRENLFTQDQADDAILDVMARRGIPLE